MTAVGKGGFAPIVATATHLAWLKEALDQALATARDAAVKGDAEAAAAAMHRVRAALSFTRLQGATQFADTVEQLLRKGGDVLPLAASGILTLRAYLDRLHAGAPDQPLALYPAYRELRLALGLSPAEANVPSDLFFPDLSLRPPARDGESAPLAPEAQAARIKAARLAFERGWQKWRHGGKDDQARALRDMRNAVAIAEQQMATADDRAFWWICIAFFDALADSPSEPGDPLRQELAPLLERIERQVTGLTENGDAVAERLLRDVLYEVAIADSAAPSVALVRSAYRLAPLMPKEAVDGAEELKRHEQRAILKAVLQAAKEDWNAFCGGSAAALPPFHEHAGRIAESAAALGLGAVPGFARLAAAVSDAASALRRNPLVAADQLHEDLSMALVLLDDAVDQRTDGEAAFAHAADDLIERIQRLLNGEDLPPLHLPPASQEIHQRLVAQVAAAAAEQLHLAQRRMAPVLAGIEPPESVRAPLRQVKGAMALLGKHGAAKVIEDLLASLSPPAADTLSQTAADLVLLTLYVEQLPWSSPDIQALRWAVNRDIPVLPASDQPFPSDPEEEAAALSAELDQLSTLSLEPLPAELESSIDPQQLPLFLKESRGRVAAIGEQLRRWRTAPEDDGYGEALRPLLADLKAAAREAGALGIAELVQGLEDRLDGLAQADDADINQLEDGFDRMVALLDMLRSDAPPPAPEVATSEYETPLAIEPRQLDRLLDQVHEIAIGRRRVESELRNLTADLSDMGLVAERLREQMRALESLDNDRDEADGGKLAADLSRDLPVIAESAADVAAVKQALQNGLERLGAILGDQTRLQRDISHGLLRLRMAPFSAISARLLNAVEREGAAHGAPVSLAIEGDGAELDRTVLARVAAVLDLLLRKAAAHRDAGPMALRIRRQADEAVIEATGLPIDLPVDICGDHLAAVGGRMDADLDAGLLRLTVPAAPALGQALLVSAGGRRYGIPSSLVESAGEAGAEELAAAERDGGILFADRFHPWHTLSALLGLPESAPSAEGKRWRLLLHSGARQIALEVDALLGRQEVAMKSLGPQLSRVRGIAGAAVLSDGDILLLIDPVILSARKLGRSLRTVEAEPTPKEVAATPTVMVVDDSPSARSTAVRWLEKAGYGVVTARDGVEALERIGDVRPVLLIVDADMPRLGGLDLIHCLRSDPALAPIPVVLASHEAVEVEPELGIVHCIGKPYEEAALLGLAKKLADDR